MLPVDLELVKKYNKPGPRYTSYPPANYFVESGLTEELSASIEASNRPERGISLYYHLPFCSSLCWFCGCNKIITTRQDLADRYIDYLVKEMELRKDQIDPQRLVRQLHYGGGTPTYFTADQLKRLGDEIHSRFTFADDAELSIEIDPRSLKPDQPSILHEQGFWRASLGIQDFNAQVQKAVHRVQPEDLTRRSVESLREAGFTSINIDLIYGLPYQTVESFTDTLERALSLKPDRFAIFNYAHVPWMIPAQRIIKEDTLPNPETKLGMLKLITETLTKHGYHYIGMDHFAIAEDELTRSQKAGTLQRNFQGYSTYAGLDIQAYGVSAISQNETAYYQNTKEMKDYEEGLDHGEWPLIKSYVLNNDDRIRRDVIMEIMCNLGLNFQRINERLGIDFKDYFKDALPKLQPMQDDGLLTLDSDAIHLTETGRLLVRNIAIVFDRFYQEQAKRYSKTI